MGIIALATTDDELRRALGAIIPAQRLIADPLRRLAYGTDASFYRLIPRLVVVVEREDEIVRLLALCRRLEVPVTFRAAGTSLSGQAVTDSVLVVLGDGWKRCEIGPAPTRYACSRASSAASPTGGSRRSRARSAPIRHRSTRR